MKKILLMLCILSSVALADTVQDTTATISGGSFYTSTPSLDATSSASGFGSLSAVTYLKDGSVFAADTVGGYLWVRDGSNPANPVRSLQDNSYKGITAVATNKKTGQIMAGRSNGTLAIINQNTLGTDHYSINLNFGVITSVGSLSNGNMVIANTIGNLFVYDQDTRNFKVAVYGHGIVSLDVSDDDRIMVADADGVAIFDSSLNAEVARVSGWGVGDISAVAFNDANDNVVVGNTAGAVYIRDATDLGGIGSGTGFGSVYDIDCQADGDIVIATNAYGGALWLRDGADLGGITYASGFGTINDIDVYTVPEPTTMCLVGLGVVGLIRRRRK